MTFHLLIQIIISVIILNQEVTVRVRVWVEFQEVTEEVGVRVARPGMFSKHGVNTSYLAQVLELNVV